MGISEIVLSAVGHTNFTKNVTTGDYLIRLVEDQVSR